MCRKSFRFRVVKYLFILPGLVFFSFAILIPFLSGVNISFTNWNGITKTYDYVGLKNFIGIFKDMRIIKPIKNTLYIALIGTVFNNILTLALAQLVNMGYKRISSTAKLAFFIPVCISAVLTAFIWGFIYREAAVTIFNIKNPLGTRNWVIPSIVLMTLWQGGGINMLIYLAGMKNIPPALYEAATVDGAGGFKKFFRITLPLMIPAFTVCVTLTLTSYLREFATVLSATGGGPADASTTISIYIFNNLYKYNKAGYGQAVSLLFMIILIVIGLSVSSFFRKREVEL